MRTWVQLESLRRAFRWHRRFFAALFAAIAVLAGLSVVASRGESGASLVVAARPVAAGAALSASDLVVQRVPASLAAEGAFSDPDALVGRVVVASVPARRLLTASDLLDAGLQIGKGDLALPVRFAESGATALLRVGASIDILGADGDQGGYAVIAAGVRVVAIPQVDSGGVLSSSQSPLVLVEVTAAQAARISAASGVSTLNFALR